MDWMFSQLSILALMFLAVASQWIAGVSRGSAAKDQQTDVVAKLPLDEIIQRVPRRVAGKDRTPGDMVNFLIVGSEDAVESALQAAGWVKVDRTKEGAILRAIDIMLQKGSYTQMPISELFLFGRSQDYGFAKALPIEVVTTRHHFRLWKAPQETADGRTVWIGAGTHDIGIERDRRDRHITHKIDSDVDKEREFIGDSLNETGMVRELRYLRPSDPVREATTATGAPFHSDGRVLVVLLK